VLRSRQLVGHSSSSSSSSKKKVIRGKNGKPKAVQASQSGVAVADKGGEIELFEIGDQLNCDLEEIIEDPKQPNSLLDDTIDEEVDALIPDCSEGYEFEGCPDVLPPVSSILAKKVLWHGELPNGGRFGWIVTEITDGPVDPQEAINGVTLRLKCIAHGSTSEPRNGLRESPRASSV